MTLHFSKKKKKKNNDIVLLIFNHLEILQT